MYSKFARFLGKVKATFANIINLLITTNIFTRKVGDVNTVSRLVLVTRRIKLPPFTVNVIFTLIALTTTIVVKSNGTPFLTFIRLVPRVTTDVNIGTVSVVLPVRRTSRVKHTVSPMSNIIVTISDKTGVAPFRIMGHATLPLVINFIFRSTVVNVFCWLILSYRPPHPRKYKFLLVELLPRSFQ